MVETAARSRAAQGVVFIVVVALLLGFTVAKYQQRLPWQNSVDVTLHTSRTGTQLEKNADVKLRGLVVGRVAAQRSGGSGAVLGLALQPSKISQIPGNVSARLLPKNLFGEKFVDLVIPPSGGIGQLREGDVITEDRSVPALEVERVLADLFPLLRSLEPEKLNRALTAIADGLRDEGDRLGATLVDIDRYLASINPQLPTIQADLSGLADLAESLDSNADELLRIARNAIVSGRTLTEQSDVLAEFLRGTAGLADTTTAILSRDGTNLVKLAADSRRVLTVVHEKRAIIPETVRDLRHLAVELNAALAEGNALNIRLEIAPNRGIYTAPCQYPRCNDAAALGPAGSPAEMDVLRALLAPVRQVAETDVPDVVSILFGPVLRGVRVGLTS